MAMALMPGSTLKAARRFANNPFTLGVASGDPTASGIVLWTRLAPEPADPTALGTASIPVRWRVARDDAMRRVVAQGTASATAELAHSVHVEVKGLRAGRRLLLPVRHRRRGEHGRPLPHRAGARRLGASAHVRRSPPARTVPSGYYTAYRDMVQNDLDLVLHLGDYTYEYGYRRLEPDGTRGRAVQRGRDRPADLPAPAHAAQARPGPAGGPRGVPVRRGLGRPRGAERLLGAGARVGVPVAGVHRPTRRRVPGVLRAPADPTDACAQPGGRAADLPPPATMAASPSSRCSTTASTAPTTRAATASRLRCDGRPRRRLHDARAAAGAMGDAKDFDDSARPVEHRRPAAVARRARASARTRTSGTGTTPGTGTRRRAPAPARRRRRRTACATRCSSPATGTRRSSTTSSSTSRTRPRRRWRPSSSRRRSPPAATTRRTARTTGR